MMMMMTMAMLYDDEDEDDDDDVNDSAIQVLASPWVVMRVLGTQFGYYVPVMPIGCEQKLIQLREAIL